MMSKEQRAYEVHQRAFQNLQEIERRYRAVRRRALLKQGVGLALIVAGFLAYAWWWIL